MGSVSQRLRELDRKVLREEKLQDADGWRKAMSRWRWMLGSTVFMTGVVAFNVLVGNKPSSIILLPMIVLTAFQAGRVRTEHERCQGSTTFMGKRRPQGL
jgi:hypothetical protein